MEPIPSDEIQRTLVACHFRLHLQQAVLALVGHAGRHGDAPDALVDAHPFLASYLTEMADHGLEGVALDEVGDLWRRSVEAWEADATRPHLPLRALRQALELDAGSLELMMLIGLIEEDARFGALFARFGATTERPSLGLLAEICGHDDDPSTWRRRLSTLLAFGVVAVDHRQAPASAWIPHIPLPVWEALRGEPPHAVDGGSAWTARTDLPTIDDLVLDDEVRASLARLEPLLANGDASAIVVRGPRSNGRCTTLKALARRLGHGAIVVPHDRAAADALRPGLMATLLDAMPIVVVDASPGETVEAPSLDGWVGPVGIVIGHEGAVVGRCMAKAVTLALPLPVAADRRRLWALGDGRDDPMDEVPDLRMSSGHIRRAALLAASHAAVDGSAVVQASHRRRAAALLGLESLDGLATRVPPLADAAQVVLNVDTAEEFAALVARCRHRERLGDAVGSVLGAQLGCGVRALFRGPSGCGKTLAARKLAATLERELYRVDLASVVDKYIGESEKKLARVLDRAEELDAVLLFDEGEALLGKRTAVQSSTDRYSNLETGFLLQRLDEGFGGILVVTTNSADQIDTAFRRRMDAVIDFPLPDALERQTLWRLHLPERHAIDETFLDEAAFRCLFAGGQIRNAVLHAALTAIDDGGTMRTAHLDGAIRREYRKSGGVCPLRGNRSPD